MDKPDADKVSGYFFLKFFHYLHDGKAYWEPVCCCFFIITLSSNNCIKKIQSFCFTTVLVKEYFSVKFTFVQNIFTMSRSNALQGNAWILDRRVRDRHCFVFLLSAGRRRCRTGPPWSRCGCHYADRFIGLLFLLLFRWAR